LTPFFVQTAISHQWIDHSAPQAQQDRLRF
jgi:hypothetical protein